jgi:hypothetical protein
MKCVEDNCNKHSVFNLPDEKDGSHWLKEIPKKEITYEYLFYDFN